MMAYLAEIAQRRKTVMNREETTGRWYKEYYQKGADRNDLRNNRACCSSSWLARLPSSARPARSITNRRRPWRWMLAAAAAETCINCCACGTIRRRSRESTSCRNVLAQAKKLYPQARFIQGDASRMEFGDNTFDLVFESTMFATLPDETSTAAIAREMVRVCKPGGFLLLADWRTPKLRDPRYLALTRKRLRRLFAVGGATRVVGVYRGVLVPPLGRFSVVRLPSVYFAAGALLPFSLSDKWLTCCGRNRHHAKINPRTKMCKRLFDVVASAVGLILASPLLLAIAAWIKLDSPGPVFYRGRRAGATASPSAFSSSAPWSSTRTRSAGPRPPGTMPA